MSECINCKEWKNQLESERQLREQMKFDAEQLRADFEAAREENTRLLKIAERYEARGKRIKVYEAELRKLGATPIPEPAQPKEEG